MRQGGARQSLAYAEPKALSRPGWQWSVGTASVLLGSLGFVFNLAVAATMAKQLVKQWTGRGASRLPIEPWLTLTVVEGVLSAALAGTLVAAGAATLYRPELGRRLHRGFAWPKLLLACGFAVWAGWATALYVAGDAAVIGAAAALAFISSAAYPLLLLRALPRR